MTTGTFARVWFARLKADKEPNQNIFALKILRKAEGELHPIPPTTQEAVSHCLTEDFSHLQ